MKWLGLLQDTGSKIKSDGVQAIRPEWYSITGYSSPLITPLSVEISKRYLGFRSRSRPRSVVKETLRTLGEIVRRAVHKFPSAFESFGTSPARMTADRSMFTTYSHNIITRFLATCEKTGGSTKQLFCSSKVKTLIYLFSTPLLLLLPIG